MTMKHSVAILVIFMVIYLSVCQGQAPPPPSDPPTRMKCSEIKKTESCLTEEMEATVKSGTDNEKKYCCPEGYGISVFSKSTVNNAMESRCKCFNGKSNKRSRWGRGRERRNMMRCKPAGSCGEKETTKDVDGVTLCCPSNAVFAGGRRCWCIPDSKPNPDPKP